jgi:hypothetical protein
MQTHVRLLDSCIYMFQVHSHHPHQANPFSVAELVPKFFDEFSRNSGNNLE